MGDKRKAYQEKLDAQLEEWNAQIALLKVTSGQGQGRGEDRKLQNHRSLAAQAR